MYEDLVELSVFILNEVRGKYLKNSNKAHIQNEVCKLTL